MYKVLMNCHMAVVMVKGLNEKQEIKLQWWPTLASSPGLPLLWEKLGRGRPGRTYHMTDVTDCGQF
jgi:hypothetical protein